MLILVHVSKVSIKSRYHNAQNTLINYNKIRLTIVVTSY